MDPQTPEIKHKKNSLRELVPYIIFALVVMIPFRMYVAQPFVVNGPSMDTTFKHGDYLIVDEVTYRFKEPNRGDVLIFKYPVEPSKFFIKRLIGLPGETVVVGNNTVMIINKEHPKGTILTEDYINSRGYVSTKITLGEDEYFVMGDNRSESYDSRSWGPVPKSDIVGRPLVRLWPLSQIDSFPGVVASSSILKN